MSCYVLLKSRGDGGYTSSSPDSSIGVTPQPTIGERKNLSGQIPNSPEKFGQLGDPSPKPIPIVPVTSQASGIIMCHQSIQLPSTSPSNNVPQLPAPNLHALWQMWMSSPDHQVGQDHSWIQWGTPLREYLGKCWIMLDPSGLLIFHCHHFRLFFVARQQPPWAIVSAAHTILKELIPQLLPVLARENQRYINMYKRIIMSYHT